MRKVQVTPGRRFLVHGVLVLLPLVLLTAMAVSWLRQDQYAVKESAKQVGKLAAREAARALAEQINSLPLQSDSNAPGNVVRFTLTDKGRLLSPAPRDRVPVPRPYPVEELTVQAGSRWRKAVEGGETGSVATRSNQWTAFLEIAPTAEWKALARYHLALTISKESPDAGSKLLQEVFARPAGVRLESGLPLVPLAAWRWMEMNSNRVTSEFLHQFCSNAIAHPGIMTETFLAAALARDGQAMQPWLLQWNQSESARRLFAASEGIRTEGGGPNTSLNWVKSDGVDWLIARRGSNVAAVAWADAVAMAESHMKEISSSSLVFLVKVADQVLIDPTMKAAPVHGSAAGSEFETLSVAVEGVPGQQVEVTACLWQNEAYWAQRHRRVWMFSVVIVLALAAAFIGLASAWRTFHQQWQLSEMKSNFVSSVSHELRAPLASVRLMAESLERGKVPEPSRQQEYFQLIGRESRRLTSLIENVLDFARIDQGRKEYQPEPTDLVALVRHTVKSMEPYAAEREVRLEMSVEGEAGEVSVDGHALQQALVNLIDNAVKHSPKEGLIQVHLRFDPDRFVVSVADSGPGIPRKEHDKIFERFYRRGSELRRETQGVGIGLSIVKHVAEAHGGEVMVESGDGRGSCFSVVLPRTGK